MDDHKIIDLIRSGSNSKVLAALYRHFPMMQKMVRTHGGSRQDAEDIFQEALIILCMQVRTKDLQLADAKPGEYKGIRLETISTEELTRRLNGIGKLTQTSAMKKEIDYLRFDISDQRRRKKNEEVGKLTYKLLLLLGDGGEEGEWVLRPAL
ncbi:MAG: hypothetical protein J7621_00665 [Niastella sp.]|nr:hypothetical protein [Niastella sp.]